MCNYYLIYFLWAESDEEQTGLARKSSIVERLSALG
jgi:hypothetical protein